MEPILRKTGETNSITDVEGIRIGNFTDLNILSGVTVVIPDEARVCGADIRGGAPGTRELALLDPVNLVQRVDALTLSGGSAFGLESASGVMSFLEESNKGYETRDGVKVPIVPAAIIYDLYRGKTKGRVDNSSGYMACRALSQSVNQGNVGAGTGAVSGGIKGGLGTASELLPRGITVGGLAIVNSSGYVADSRFGGLYAGYLELGEEFGLMRSLRIDVSCSMQMTSKLAENTVLGVVATDVALSKSEAKRVAIMAHDGIPRAIMPSHTLFDGDVVFSLAGQKVVDDDRARLISLIGSTCADVLSRAIVHGVLAADSTSDFLSYRDRFPEAFS
jgi:L-aminopeptidase/D-esterase-like protein